MTFSSPYPPYDPTDKSGYDLALHPYERGKMTITQIFVSKLSFRHIRSCKSTFPSSYETVVKRWPIILTSVIDDIHCACHFLSLETKKVDITDEEKQLLDRKIKEGATIIEMISKLKYEIARDHVLV